jgi:hypothetical protein
MNDPVKKMWELASERNKLQAAWNRHLLTLASGGLALLVGLRPEIPADIPGKALLGAAWAFLGIGILSGGAATYAEVSLAKRLALALQSRLERRMEERRPLTDESQDGPLHAQAGWVSRNSCHVMVLSLMGAVVSFVSYSILEIVRAP